MTIAASRPNAVVTCEIQLFQNSFGLRRRPSELTEIIVFSVRENLPKLFLNYFRGLLQLTNIFEHV